ncbi:MAG: squalene synthase HpnC [Lautropia sp.]|nr:squalene synthase HpnC [Lautropia sp.]
MNVMPPAYEATPWHGVDHPENFPVASWLVPARLRPAVRAIYRFARHADDLADEGEAPLAERQAALQALAVALRLAQDGQVSGVAPVDGLIGPVTTFGLEWQHFHDLLDAFSQDLRVNRYASETEVLAYCRRSANPVGRLMLQLYGVASPVALVQSDAVCSALQRINFLQDVGIDAARDRVYLPASTLAAAGCSAEQLLEEARAGQLGPACRRAIHMEWVSVQAQLLSGNPLSGLLPGRLAAELRFILAGGQRILDRIAQAGYDSVASRPALGWHDAPALLWLALFPRRHARF